MDMDRLSGDRSSDGSEHIPFALLEKPSVTGGIRLLLLILVPLGSWAHEAEEADLTVSAQGEVLLQFGSEEKRLLVENPDIVAALRQAAPARLPALEMVAGVVGRGWMLTLSASP